MQTDLLKYVGSCESCVVNNPNPQPPPPAAPPPPVSLRLRPVSVQLLRVRHAPIPHSPFPRDLSLLFPRTLLTYFCLLSVSSSKM